LSEELEAILRSRSVAEWLHLLGEAGIPCGPINDVGQVLADPQIRARNMVVSIDDPELSDFRLAGNPVKLSAYADPPSRARAPELDADRRRILDEL
jgi:CoA:oxalate CoA-transferase